MSALASERYRSLPSQPRARRSLSLICPSEQPVIHCRHGSVERGVCTDVTRRGGQDARRNQWEENLRHASSRGARRCAERQAAPATRGDFGAFLIDIWRLEMAASHWKHTMGAQSNRHVCGRPFATIFCGRNGARMRENRRAVVYSRRLRGKAARLKGGRYESNGAATATTKAAGLEAAALHEETTTATLLRQGFGGQDSR
jgi:hypothetical protein